MHIVNGVGDLLGLIRDELPRRAGSANLGPEAGPGESDYTRYDRSIAEATVNWLHNDAPMVRRAITAYCGLTSFLDDNVGKILHAPEVTGLAENTRIVYSSDHGDNLGTRGQGRTRRAAALWRHLHG